VLTRANRLTSSQEFAPAIRSGRRTGTRTLVLHLATGSQHAGGDGGSAPRIGFVVSKAVGSAVVRNKVKRRLRHLARERLTSLPGSAVLVVRALPPAAQASYDELATDLDRALDRVTARADRGTS
jgi:ribonuclease P protein component